MDIMFKLAQSGVLIGFLLFIVGVIGGALTGFTDNWALKVAAGGAITLAGTLVIVLVFLAIVALLKIWS